MSESKSRDLTSGPVIPILFQLSYPMAIGITANMSFNLVDTWFIGQLGVEQLTAISFSFPVVMILLNLAIGQSIGLTSVASRLLGKGKEAEVQSLGWIVILATCGISALIAFLGIQTIEPTFKLMGAGSDSVDLIKDYMWWAYWAMAFRMVAMTTSGLFKAHGVTKVPSLIIVTTASINFVLDPILIFGFGPIPALGIEGAGIATFFANFIAVTLEVFLAFRYGFVRISHKGAEVLSTQWFDVARIGLPAALGNSLNPLAVSLINYFLSLKGAEWVAGFGVASKVQMFLMIPVLALSAALGAVIGQNFGQDNPSRLREILCKSIYFSAAWGLAQGLLMLVSAHLIASLFTDSKPAIELATRYLMIVSWSLIGYSVVIVASSSFNAIGKPLLGILPIFARTTLFFLLFYGAYQLLGIDNEVSWAVFSGNIAAGLCSFWVLRLIFGSLFSNTSS